MEPRIMDRLRKRRDFLAAAKGERAGSANLMLQGRARRDGDAPRLGFTVTKKNGNAVMRNRIRRRLREAARKVLPEDARPGHDYVIVAREQALRAPFADLVRDLSRAVKKIHAPPRSRSDAADPRRRPRPQGGPAAAAPHHDISTDRLPKDHPPTPTEAPGHE